MIRHLRHFAREVRDISVETFDITVDTLTKFFREIGELGEAPDRTRQGIVAACSVVLATFLALLLEIQSPWWAAISAFMSLSATGGGSLRRGILRMTGTAAGALLGFVMARWLPYDHFAMYLFIGGVTMLGVIAMQVSPHGLAWLFLCITSILVLLESLNNPLQAACVAYYRMFEVGIGVLSAIIVANLLQDWHREPAPTAPGWRHLLGAQWSGRPARRALGDRGLRGDGDLDGARGGAGRRDGHHRRRGDGRPGGRRRRVRPPGMQSPFDRCTASWAACWAVSWRSSAWP